MPNKKTQEEAISKFKLVHGNRYDYSKLIYKNSSTKVEIFCSVHGSFTILPNHHQNGVGCRKCYFESQKLSMSEFISRSRKHFGDRYDYSRFSDLPPIGIKVEIRCNRHDEIFQQEPRSHQLGHTGCHKCKYLKNVLRTKHPDPNLDEPDIFARFCIRARKVHGEKYSYENFIYVNTATSGIITCSDHGDFYQIPSNHLRGSGCPRCAKLTMQSGTFKQRCQTLGIDYWRALKRRQAGMTEERILNEGYVRTSRETECITIRDTTYPNIVEAVRALNPPASPKTISRWIKSGISPEEAFTRVPNPGYADGIVYLLTHFPSGKKYVGITIQKLERRWEYHLEQAKSGYIKNRKSLHAAIRKYGVSEFTLEQIDSGSSKGTLEAKERSWIKRLGTVVPHGFNISVGGTSGGSNSRPEIIDGIKFPSVKSATAYLAETRDISLHAAAKRILTGRIDVEKPALPGKSLVKTPAYKAWSRIVHGVLNPKSVEFIPGIKIHEPWRIFKKFLSDVSQPSKSGMAFARIDKTKGFFPKNCIWMSKSEASIINAKYMKENDLLVGRKGKITTGNRRYNK